MAFSGGVFTRLYNWVSEQASSPIEIAKLDTQEEDFATGLSNCILRDGTGVPSADTPWNSKKITGLGAATATGDAADCGIGTFTGTLVGLTTSPTATCYYVRVGKLVVLSIYRSTSLVGTSNSTGFSMSGVPSDIRPTRSQWVPVPSGAFSDNGTSSAGDIAGVIDPSGVLYFYRNNTLTGWTSTGTKGIFVNSSNGVTITYLLT
jgi:hypothetical protein